MLNNYLVAALSYSFHNNCFILGSLAINLPERTHGYYALTVERLRTPVHYFAYKLVHHRLAAYSYAASREIFWPYAPLFTEYAFAFCMTQLPAVLRKWNVTWQCGSHTFDDASIAAQDPCCQNNPEVRASLNTELNQSLGQPQIMQWMQEHQPVPEQEVRMLSSLLEYLELSILNNNWRYQLTRGLLYFLQNDYIAATLHLTKAENIFTQQGLQDPQKCKQYMSGGQLVDVEDKAIKRAVNKIFCNEPRSKRLFGIRSSYCKSYCFARDEIQLYVIDNYLQNKDFPRTLILAHDLLGDCNAIELLNQSLKRCFTVTALKLKKIIPPSSKSSSALSSLVTTDEIYHQLGVECQQLHELMPQLLNCCSLGMMLPNFSGSFEKRVAQFPQSYAALYQQQYEGTTISAVPPIPAINKDKNEADSLMTTRSTSEEDAQNPLPDFFTDSYTRYCWYYTAMHRLRGNFSYDFKHLLPHSIRPDIDGIAQILLQQKYGFHYPLGHMSVGTPSALLADLLQIPTLSDKYAVSWVLQEWPIMCGADTLKAREDLFAHGKSEVYELMATLLPNLPLDLYQRWEQQAHLQGTVSVDVTDPDLVTKLPESECHEIELYKEHFPCPFIPVTREGEKHSPQIVYGATFGAYLGLYDAPVPIKGMLFSLSSLTRNFDWEVSPWIYRYVKQRLQLQSEATQAAQETEGKVTSQPEQQDACVSAPDFRLEVNNLPFSGIDMTTFLYFENYFVFVPIKPKETVRMRTDGELPEYQMPEYTPLLLKGFHRGNLFAESIESRAQTPQGESLRYEVFVQDEYGLLDHQLDDEGNLMIKEMLHRILCLTLGSSWVEQHVGRIRFVGRYSIDRYLKAAQHIDLPTDFYSPGSTHMRVNKGKYHVPDPDINESQALKDVAPFAVYEDDSWIDWAQAFAVSNHNLEKLKYLKSWQQFFGPYEPTELFYNYSLHDVYIPSEQSANKLSFPEFKKISQHLVYSSKLLLCQPPLQRALDLISYQELAHAYPLREDVYHGTTACYQLLVEYYQGNLTLKQGTSTLNSNLGHLLRLHAFAGFIYIPLGQLEQTWSMGELDSENHDATVTTTTDPNAGSEIEAAITDASSTAASRGKGRGRSRKAVAKACPDGMTKNKDKVVGAGAVTLSPELLAQAQKIWNKVQGLEGKPKRRSKTITKAEADKPKVPTYSAEVQQVAYFLSCLKDLSAELKAIIGLDVDVVGYALGHQNLYLDLLIWDWNKFLEQSSKLGQSEVAKRYGIRALSFHSFARKGDSVPLDHLALHSSSAIPV